MRLRRLDLSRYGKFTDFSIDFGTHAQGTPDFHIIYGLNEAGKSTSLSAYLDLLFGIEERTKYGFLHQGKSMEIGGCLEFDGHSHEFKRVKQRTNSLLNLDGQPVNEAVLGAPLAGLTREAYRMMFSLDDQTLEDGGNAILESKGDLGELLFSASAGLAGINTILERTAAEADGIFRKRASSTQIAGIKREIAALKSERDELDVQASSYRNLITALDQAETAYNGTMKEVGAARARQDEIARMLRAYPLAADYRSVQKELERYQDLPHPPKEWAAEIAHLVVEEMRLRTALDGIAKREDQIGAELEQLVVDDRVLDLSDQIERLSDAAARYGTAREDLPKREAALAEATRKLDLLLAKLGQADIDDPRGLLVPAATIGALRDLISARSGVEVALQSAQSEHDVARQALEAEERARQMLEDGRRALDAGQIAQLQSVLGRLREGHGTAELRRAERDLETKRAVFDQLASQMGPSIGDGDALGQVLLPSRERLERWARRFAELESRRGQTIERERELESKEIESEARLSAFDQNSDIVGDEPARAALVERDAAWEHHLSCLERETATRFEALMRKADGIAHARLKGAKALNELRSLKTELAVIKANRSRQRVLLRDLDAELEALTNQIRSQTPLVVGLSEDGDIQSWLATIGRWSENRSKARMAWEDLRHLQRDVEQTKVELEAERKLLAQGLTSAGLQVEGLDLFAMIQAADTLLNEQARFEIERVEADKRFGGLKAGVSARRLALEGAQGHFQEWQRNWAHALSTTWFADRAESTGAVAQLLDALAGLPQALRERDDLRYRIDAMEADRAAFIDSVAKLHETLEIELDGSEPIAAAKALIGRFERGRGIKDKRQEREKALLDLAGEREAIESEIAIHSARAQTMTAFFSCETLSDVRGRLEMCSIRDGLLVEHERLERQIVADMQVVSVDSGLEILAAVEVSQLQQERAELRTRLEDLDGRAKNLFADKARASDRLAAIGGDDAVARLDGRRRTLVLELEELALRYLRLKSGGLVAQHGLHAYRDKHRSAMMDRASQAFHLMTRKAYSGLTTRPDKDREVLIVLARNGGSKLATELSKGTQFQLYLALRLAGYEEFAALRPSVPFIADDIMETFDEPRSEEVFRLLGQMAQVGQVIYLTHHRHLCEIASQVVPQLKVHEIA